MRVALMTEYHHIGGGESNLLNLCEELSKSIEVVLFCDGAVYQKASELGLACRKTDLSGKRWLRFIPFLSFPAELRKELNSFDVVHSYSLNVLSRLAFLKCPVIWTTHGFWESPFGLRAKVINLIVDKVVAVSTDVYDICSFGSDKLSKIFLGTKMKGIQGTKKEIDPRNITISCIGRFQRIKGQDILLSALMDIAKERRDINIKLHFVGGVNSNKKEDIDFHTELHSIVETQRHENLDVVFDGFQADISPFLTASDFIVVPSRYESFSMVAIEALAYGKAVICPNIGGPKDIINAKNIGILFTPEDSTALKKSILEMIESFEMFDPEQARARAEDFSIVRQAREHLTIYQDACNG